MKDKIKLTCSQCGIGILKVSLHKYYPPYGVSGLIWLWKCSACDEEFTNTAHTIHRKIKKLEDDLETKTKANAYLHKVIDRLMIWVEKHRDKVPQNVTCDTLSCEDNARGVCLRDEINIFEPYDIDERHGSEPECNHYKKRNYEDD